MLHQLSSRLLEDDGLAQQLGEIERTLAQHHGSTRGLVALLEQGGNRLGLAAAQGLGEAALAQVGAAMAATAAPGALAALAPARQLGKRVVVEDTETAPAVERWRALARAGPQRGLARGALHAADQPGRDVAGDHRRLAGPAAPAHRA